MNKYQIAFIIEQALGHVTHGQNLRALVPQDTAVQAHWALPEFPVSGLAAKIPLYKSNWTVRAGLRSRRLLRQMARQTRLDALFWHTQVTAVLNPDWLRRIPSIISLDATPLQYDELGEFYAHEPGPAWLERQKWRLNRDAFRAARHIVGWTHWTKEGLVRDYEVPPHKISVIPPGVTVADWLRPTPRAAHTGPVKILFVGGDLARKGGLLLLDAFRTLRERHAVELHLVTRDKVAAEPGLFVYNNMQPNSAPLKQLYFGSDIFCLPTFGDCLPMVLSEAGAAGLTAVSTRVAGIPEIVQHGETGLLVPAGDTAALTQALEQLVLDGELRRRMGETAVARITAHFDADKNAARLLALLKQVADGTEIGD
ncbi:MAG: glycosyltransferase family 4 protein [Anaerolineales bacterium]|nr:glycosyltransferase family 4 protein [Anaerolineales bacterium]MCB8983672.1 glycosyltransferase family 4 protein [Ardenticatenaceae bacterium]